MDARLHSIETMGLVDGPGIRTVFFLQGCPLRCAYCHNPDSQSMFSKKHITPDEVLSIAKKYRSYYKRTGGGVTFSGGEPLLQGEFLLESLKLLKAEGIDTAVDTSGYGDFVYFDQILKYTDTVLLDIKHFDTEGYLSLTARPITGFYRFLSHLENYQGKIWIRHVMVPGITDNDDAVLKIFSNIRHLSDKVEKIEILPYHKLGLEKYEQLGIDYPLEGIDEMDKQKARHFEEKMMIMLSEEKMNKRKNIG